MDQESDRIRQDIESTRASLDEKLDRLETKARKAFDLKHQFSEHPWAAIGAAIAAGYLVGNIARKRMHTDGWSAGAAVEDAGEPVVRRDGGPSGMRRLLSHFDQDIDLFKAAAFAMLSDFLHESINRYVPSYGRQLDKVARERGRTRPPASGGSRPQSPPAQAESFSRSEASRNLE